jgi:hypothetical protein
MGLKTLNPNTANNPKKATTEVCRLFKNVQIQGMRTHKE